MHSSTRHLVDSSQTTDNKSIRGGMSSISVSSSLPTDEIDNHLSQIRYKKTVQDETAENGNSASAVLSSPQVSKVMASLFGSEKMELSTDTRQTLKTMEEFFKELIKATSVNNGSKVKEALNEVFHNPEEIVFQQILCNPPEDWAVSALQLVQDVAKKEALCEEIDGDIKDIKQKRRELAKDAGILKKELEEMKQSHKKKLEKLNPDNIRRLKIALESYKSEADKLEEIRSQNPGASDEDVEKILTDFEALKVRHEKAKNDLHQVSGGGVLPPNIEQARAILAQRKAYLASLQDQIANPDLSSTLDDSVFTK
ncbi:hypothetical protein Ocin01_02988 [Orchesella cincta]|uniref:Uncharacterized protein n=1 Tax=Orchesella cincta TaxID=48709 RepID=A0A1D2NEL9_ORCCI|nr:hypothetical protein Ocin01_02988 [Orchesella cincta]